MDNNNLKEIRNKIDEIDYAIHDLLIKRAECVDGIIDIKKQDDTQKFTAYRPAREAEILKNILSRHKGKLPYSTIIGFWRFMLSSFCSLQADFSIAYFGLSEPEALRDAIRYYFGSVIKIKKSGTESSVLHSVSSNEVTIGILPIGSVDTVDEWWLKIPKGIYISGILPYVKDDNAVSIRQDYMIVSNSEPVETGNDKSLFRIFSNPDVGRVTVVGFFNELKKHSRSICIYDTKDLAKRFHLIEVEGFFNKDSLSIFIETLKKNSSGKIRDIDYLGSYPVPISLLDYQKS